MQAADELKKIACLIVVVLSTASCVYFNALYNANRLFDRGRDEIEAGNFSSGASLLGQSIDKAERIVAHHPDSRWADDAWRLIVRSHLLREEWPEAAQAARELLGRVRSREDSVEVAGYLGIAQAELGAAAAADSLLSTGLTASMGADRKARLLFYRGRTRVALGRAGEADSDLRQASEFRPDWVDPRLERLRLLSEMGEAEGARAELRRMIDRRQPAGIEARIVETAQEAADADPRVGRMLLEGIENSQLSRTRRADLLALRARLALADHDTAAAESDLRGVMEAVRESPRAGEAYLTLIDIRIRRAADTDDLQEIRVMLTRSTTGRMGTNLTRVRELMGILRRIEYWIERGGIGYIAAAETARDELRALVLARNLFLEYVRADPDALWAPKAILAALALLPLDSGDTNHAELAAELRRRLVEDYRDSAYVEVLLGGARSDFSYEELETGLARQLDRLRFQADQELEATRTTGRSR